MRILPTVQGEAEVVERFDKPPYQYPPMLDKLASFISDPERRTALQLAFLQRFPKTRTPCCGEQVCFRCKTSGWHQETCEERQRKEVGNKVCFCPHCGVPTVKSEGCDHMVCVCGRDWTWGVDPLVEMLQDGNRSAVERLLNELADINAPLDGRNEPPVDIFLRCMQPGPDAIEIMKVFAKLGARASPSVHRERLFEACHDLDLLKLLLEHFRGVSSIDLTQMLSESIMRFCSLARSKFGSPEFRKAELARQAEIMTLLIKHGALVGEAATHLYKLSAKHRSGFPVDLEKLLALSPQVLDKDDVAELLEDKLTRDFDRCASRFHDAKHRAHLKAKYAQKRTVRPRGGKRKCGYLEDGCC